jgi:hypothetical protein
MSVRMKFVKFVPDPDFAVSMNGVVAQSQVVRESTP